ncbi:hypothetical protein GCM10020331_079060 [Ectobacillus funiculus]
MQAVKAGAFTVPGDGSIEFDEVFTTLAASDYTGWFVVEAEQDPALANPLEYAMKARRYIGEKNRAVITVLYDNVVIHGLDRMMKDEHKWLLEPHAKV